jgi:hypothetical protein
MQQILVSESNRGWQSLNEDPKKYAAVTADDIQKAANIYFTPENRAVAIYYTKKSEGGDEDPLMTGLDDQQKVQFRQFKAAIAKMPVTEAKAILAKIEPQAAAAPQEQKAFIQALQKLLQEKIQKDGGK